MTSLDPTLSTLKALFALSCNSCAVPGCEEVLAKAEWPEVMADIAHIHGRRPGAARYEPTMTDQDRRHFDNLVLVCPNHHRLIDRLEPDDYPPEKLRSWKQRHEERCRGDWASERELSRYSALLLRQLNPLPPPSIRLERDKDAVYIANEGDGAAIEVSIELVDEDTPWMPPGNGESVLARLSPHDRWRAGMYAPSLTDASSHRVRVRWADENGRWYEEVFHIE